MSATEHRIPLSMADEIAARFMTYVNKACSVVSIAGSVRRRCLTVGDIELTCSPIHPIAINALFPEGYKGMVKNGNRMKSFHYDTPKYGLLKIELYICDPDQFGRILAIRTGSSVFSHAKLAMAWNRMGWAGTEDGLRRRRECEKKGAKWIIKPEFKDAPILPPAFPTEESFFQFLNIPWIRPEDRSWISDKHPELNYSV